MPRPSQSQTPAAYPAWLAGGAPPAASDRTPAANADLLQEAVEQLAPISAGSEAVRHVVDGLKSWLAEGGDLNVLLGVRAGRGKASELPYRKARMGQRDDAIRQLANDVGRKTIEDRARAVVDLVKSGDPRVLAIHQQATVAVPSSLPQIKRILRAAPSGDHQDDSV